MRRRIKKCFVSIFIFVILIEFLSLCNIKEHIYLWRCSFSLRHLSSNVQGWNNPEDLNMSDVKIIEAHRKEHFATSSKIADQITFMYPTFNITLPHFISKRHKTMFNAISSNLDVVGVPTREKLMGRVYIIRNASFVQPFDCGYRNDIMDILQFREVSGSRKFRLVMPLVVPNGGTFQHFLDGVLPKLIQAFDYIKNPQLNVVLAPIRDSIIFEMLEKLNISRDRISFYSERFSADYLVFTCITPPVHPVLWEAARYLLGASVRLNVPKHESKIVIVTRDGCHNCDRNLLNTDALVSELQTKYTKERVVIFRGPYDLNKTLELFSKTKVVIGSHGGGLYNINFCPKGTVVIAIMPTYSNGKTIAAADTIIWTQSVILGHHYWRLPSPPVNYLGDVAVNITMVMEILETSDTR